MSSTSLSVVKEQPTPMEAPKSTLGGRLKAKLTTKEGWIGEYNYAWLCMPSLPFMRRKNLAPPFFPLHAELPLALAFATGLQHSLAMVGAIITPPIIYASSLNLDNGTASYMISAALIACGILSFVQMSRLKLFGRYYLGTGLLSVVGTSFATLTTATAIFDAMYKDGTCATTKGADGSVTREPCPDAYGMVLGTALICSFLEIFMSFVPARILKRIFPPLVTGLVIVMIGASLLRSSAIPNWGGGSNDCKSMPTSGIFQLCPTIHAPKPLPWGSPQFIGLGFLSFASIILVEIFGSPFLKNVSIIVGFMVGCIVAGATGYMDASAIKTAPPITFLWVHTFKLGVYPPAILPMCTVYIILAMEAIGDITASSELSGVPVEGDEFDSRIQGGVLSDGLGGFFAALFTVTPLTVYAQNNGVIALTRCASVTAGRFCCFFLILFGVISKLPGVFLSIPYPVFGGVTSFLFASVATSGIKVLTKNLRFTRKEMMVLTGALVFGFGDLLVPGWFLHLFDSFKSETSGMKGLTDSVEILLSTPSLAAGIMAVLLNLILPEDEVTVAQDAESDLEAQEPKELPVLV